MNQPLAIDVYVALNQTFIIKTMSNLVDFVNNELVAKNDFPAFGAGDTITVYYEIKEGEKTRTQFFKGVVIQRRGAGATETFTIRKMSGAVGVERIFPINMPALRKSDHDNIDYLKAEKSGRAYIATGDGIIDEDEVINWLVNHIQKLQEKYTVTFLYDSWGVDYIADSIDKALPNLIMLPVKQTTPFMSPPSIFTQQLLVENKLHFISDDNILESALLNARVTKNDYGIKVVKDTYSNKIDNLYSVLIAMFEAQYALKNYTNNTDNNFFAGMNQQQIDDYYKEYKF